MLEVKDLTCGYDGKEIIHHLGFSVNRGDSLCIVGPNGSGKTTLLKALLHLIDYEGTVLFEGRDLKEIPRKSLSANIAYLTQLSPVYFSYSVFETVALGRYPHHKGPFSALTPEEIDLINDCIESVGLADIRNRQITDLSGGQLQRVFLARVFAQDPRLILLDEPTNHLDIRYQLELLDRLREWSHQKERALIGVLHDLNQVYSFATDVMLLENGEIAAYGACDEVFRSEVLSRVYKVDVSQWMRASLHKWS